MVAITRRCQARKDQPFYHLLAENDTNAYTAYVSEQNLLIDESGKEVGHPQVDEMFGEFRGNSYEVPDRSRH